MKPIHIKVKLDPGAKMPKKAHASDIGYDITALSVTKDMGTIYPHSDVEMGKSGTFTPDVRYHCVVCDTGVHVQPEPGYYVELVPNSRLAKSIYIYGNSIGVIDPDYRGSIKVIFNQLPAMEYESYRYPEPGDVVGQLIVRKAYEAEFTEVAELDDTERGAGGFGSTETKN